MHEGMALFCEVRNGEILLWVEEKPRNPLNKGSK
jgi:hypothetical protein